MRKNATVAAILVATLALAGCSSNTADLEGRIADLENRVAALEQGASTSKDSSGDSAASADDGQTAVAIGEATFENEAYGDERVIIVPMTFTNDSGKATSFIGTAQVDAYQDGVALSSAQPASWSGGLPRVRTDQSVQIQPGTTIDVANAYELRSTSPVTVEVRPISSDDVIAQKTFEVS